MISRTGNGLKTQRGRKTSNSVKSLPPVIFQTIPVALSMPISNKGDWIAFNAASLARVFPAQITVLPERVSMMMQPKHSTKIVH